MFPTTLFLFAFTPALQPPTDLALHLRTKVETAPGSGRYHMLTQEARWDVAKTAIIICDMWDKHWCPGATASGA